MYKPGMEIQRMCSGPQGRVDFAHSKSFTIGPAYYIPGGYGDQAAA